MSDGKLNEARAAAAELDRLERLRRELPRLEVEQQRERQVAQGLVHLGWATDNALGQVFSLAQRREKLHERLAELVIELREVKADFLNWQTSVENLRLAMTQACGEIVVARSTNEDDIRSGRARERADRLFANSWPAELGVSGWPTDGARNSLLTWLVATGLGEPEMK